MVICIVALVVFGFLGIFSVKYRRLAAESFNCVFRMVTLRKCETNLDERIRAKLVGKLIGVPALAKFAYKNFKSLSWVFTILFFASAILVAQAVYNLATYGTCDPVTGDCIFVPSGSNCVPGQCEQANCTNASQCLLNCTCEAGKCVQK